MTNTKAVRTGKLFANNGGLCDYLALGYLERGGDRIPCKIGYNDYEDIDGVIEPIFVFIQEDGVTDSGNHYSKETINLARCSIDVATEISL